MEQAIEFLRKLKNSIACSIDFEKGHIFRSDNFLALSISQSIWTRLRSLNREGFDAAQA